MPAATTTTTIAPEPPQQQLWYRPTGDKVLEPFSNSITAAEHKIRNLEKRKQKLDQYRNEQAEGKTLNADQLAAVAKYQEVIQVLEHNRELVSCLRQVHQQTIKFIKQELRRENLERNKFFLCLQAGLDQLQDPNVQNDLIHGENGAQKLNKDDIVELTELTKVLKPSLREPDFGNKLEAGAELVAKLFESRGKINNRPSHQVKTLVDSLVESQYFKSGPISAVPIETMEEIVTIAQEAPNSVHVVPEVPLGYNQVFAQMMIEHNYSAHNFMPESQLEIDSPYMDPAVVAVSSFAPHSPLQLQPQPDANHVFNSDQVNESMNTILSAVRDLNLNHNINSHNNGDGEIEVEEWDDKLASGTFNNTSSANGNMKEENGQGDDGNRSSFRGRGGRSRGGRGNGYNGYGNSRPPKNGRGGGGGGYNQSRYFRADRIGQSAAETAEFRGKGGRGGFPRFYRGNNRNAPPSGAGGPPRRGRGEPPKAYNNGIHENRASAE